MEKRPEETWEEYYERRAAEEEARYEADLRAREEEAWEMAQDFDEEPYRPRFDDEPDEQGIWG